MKRGYTSDTLAIQSNDTIKNEHLDIKRQIPMDYLSQQRGQHHVTLTGPLPQTLSPTVASTTVIAATATAGNNTTTSQLPHNGINPDEARKYEDLRKRISSFIPECKNCPIKRVILDHFHGAYICTECGLQTGVYIIESAEWRNFGSDGGSVSNNSRATVDNEDFGTSTMIDGKSSLATRHTQANQSREQRRLADLYHILQRIKNTLHLQDTVVKRAMEICHLVVFTPVDGKTKASGRDALAAACMHLACQELNQDRRQTEFINAANVRDRAFNTQIRHIQRIQRLSNNGKAKDSWVEPNNLARGYCERLNLSLDFIDLVHAIITSVRTNGISSGSKSAPLAAAAVYFAQLIKPETRTKENDGLIYDLYISTSVGQETIRKIARELYDKRLAIVPENYADKKTIESMPHP